MIPLPISVPACETRLGPSLCREETANIFQGHWRLAVLSQLAFFSVYFKQRCVHSAVWSFLVTASVENHFVSKVMTPLTGGGYVMGRWVSEWYGGEPSTHRPQWPALCRGLLTPMQRLGWLLLWTQRCMRAQCVYTVYIFSACILDACMLCVYCMYARCLLSACVLHVYCVYAQGKNIPYTVCILHVRSGMDTQCLGIVYILSVYLVHVYSGYAGRFGHKQQGENAHLRESILNKAFLCPPFLF